MNRTRIPSILVALLILIGWPQAATAGDKGSQFGMVYGLSVPDAENTSPFYMFGFKGCEFLVPQFSLGGYYMQSDHSGEQDAQNQFRYSLTGIEAAGHITGGSGDTFVAFRTGITKLQETPNGSPIIYSPYHYGIATGYDFYFNSTIVLGFEGSYLHVLPGRTTNGGTTYNQDSFNLINFLVSIQVRL